MVLAVGTPSGSGGEPDVAQLHRAVRALGEHRGPVTRVLVIKSTVPVGTSDRLSGWLTTRRATAPPVVVCPEFLREGSAVRDALYPDRVVVGTSGGRGLKAVRELFRPILEQDFLPPPGLPRPPGLERVPLIVTRPSSAELIKYAANAYLALKVSFINEVAALAERTGADIREVVRGVGADRRIGTGHLQPGIGWGGPCLGKDTLALVRLARSQSVPLATVEAARQVNEGLRLRVLEFLEAELGGLAGRTVALLGLAFKPGTDDLRDSPALDLAERLVAAGARVAAHDPVAIEKARRDFRLRGVTYFADPLQAARGADAVVIATDWPEYRALDWHRLPKTMRRPLVFDGRCHLDPEEVEAAGLTYLTFGRGS